MARGRDEVSLLLDPCRSGWQGSPVRSRLEGKSAEEQARQTVEESDEGRSNDTAEDQPEGRGKADRAGPGRPNQCPKEQPGAPTNQALAPASAKHSKEQADRRQHDHSGKDVRDKADPVP